ncbi:hypothetical protein B9Z65_4042 [Elsinoe australis]|uniref:Uncharacterized protein n=1 Tax=Elsinoe australis TaxID=40998 RepID=A0A2P7Z1P7_9PEZI|nr:hypothetical protein B9Z65_4042 [Elsinoe australis]
MLFSNLLATLACVTAATCSEAMRGGPHEASVRSYFHMSSMVLATTTTPSSTFTTSAIPATNLTAASELSKRDKPHEGDRFFGRCSVETQLCRLFQMHRKLGNHLQEHGCSKHHKCMQDGDICGYRAVGSKRTVCDWWYYKRLPEDQRGTYPEDQEPPSDTEIAVMQTAQKDDPYAMELRCKYYGNCKGLEEMFGGGQ